MNISRERKASSPLKLYYPSMSKKKGKSMSYSLMSPNVTADDFHARWYLAEVLKVYRSPLNPMPHIKSKWILWNRSEEHWLFSSGKRKLLKSIFHLADQDKRVRYFFVILHCYKESNDASSSVQLRLWNWCKYSERPSWPSLITISSNIQKSPSAVAWLFSYIYDIQNIIKYPHK